ncbi:MAG: DUF1016 family protein [Treponema sp.]|nr:DUF1016 family protein [Treponema sp.]
MKKKEIDQSNQNKEYNILIENVGIALKNSRQNIANTINTEIVLTYWQIGKYIIDYEQKGNEKAEYGSNMLNKLSSDLTQKYGKGFSRSNVFYIRKFYMEYPKVQTVSELLSWSHYVGRQQNIIIAGRTYKVDLVFYHRILKCFVLIDLKRGEIQHEDIGQMNFYLNYYREEMNTEGDTEPIGIVLGAYQDKLVMQYVYKIFLIKFLSVVINYIYQIEIKLKQNFKDFLVMTRKDEN